MYRIVVVYRILGYWKHGVTGYGNMDVLCAQQYKLRLTSQGDHIRLLHKGCEPHLLTLPTFCPPPPLSWALRLHKRHLSNHLFFLLFYWTTGVYVTISLGVITHLRVSSRYIIFSHIPTVSSALLVQPLLVVAQIRGHTAGSLPPPRLRYVPCIFIARRVQHFFSVVDSRRYRFDLVLLLLPRWLPWSDHSREGQHRGSTGRFYKDGYPIITQHAPSL